MAALSREHKAWVICPLLHRILVRHQDFAFRSPNGVVQELHIIRSCNKHPTDVCGGCYVLVKSQDVVVVMSL